MEDLKKKIAELSQINSLFEQDFFLSWNKSGSDMRTLVTIAEILKRMHDNNLSTRVFDSGIAAALIKNNSLQTRTAYAFAANLLGLEFVDLPYTDFSKIHGTSIESNTNLISTFTDFIGISDDVNTNDGHKYMQEIASTLDQSHKAGILPRRPGIINLQCDRDYPIQSIADVMFLETQYSKPSDLRTKKVVITWTYSPEYDHFPSIPQSAITMMSRLGMHVELCHPEGYDLSPESIKVAQRMAKYSGGSFKMCSSMDESLKDADIVYPKSWVPYHIMNEHIKLVEQGKTNQIENLKKEYLEDSVKYKNWEYNEEKEKLTKNGDALFMNSYPLTVSGLSSEHGEVSKAILDKHKTNTYLQNIFKPYVIAAIMLGYKFEHPTMILKNIIDANKSRLTKI